MQFSTARNVQFSSAVDTPLSTGHRSNRGRALESREKDCQYRYPGRDENLPSLSYLVLPERKDVISNSLQ